MEDLKLKIEDIFTKRNIDVDLKTSWDILQYLREVNSVMPQIINTIDKSLNVSLDVTHGTLINGFGHAVRDMMKTILSLQNNIRDEIRKKFNENVGLNGFKREIMWTRWLSE